jgi:hypothetical protein
MDWSFATTCQSNRVFEMAKRVLKLILLAFLCAHGNAIPPFHNWVYMPADERPEAYGYVVAYGDSAYGTSIGLSASPRYQGDSAVVAFILRANDTDNQSAGGYKPHRGHIDYKYRGYAIGTTHIIGVEQQCPCYFGVWYYVSGLPLHSHSGGRDDDWNSIYTFTKDTTDNFDSVITVNENTQGYVYAQHVPLSGQAIHLYQADSINDPTGSKKLTRNKWHLVQVLLDTKYSHKITVWVDGKLSCIANVSGRTNTVAQWHAGLYSSAATGSGTVLNDEIYGAPVKDSLEAILIYMATPPGR